MYFAFTFTILFLFILMLIFVGRADFNAYSVSYVLQVSNRVPSCLNCTWMQVLIG